MSREFTESTTRVCRLEVSKVSGVWKEVTSRWHAQQKICQQITNAIWQTWLVYHVNNGSADKLREWLDARSEVGVKAAGKCPVACLDAALARHIYKVVHKKFTPLHSRVRDLLMNEVTKKIKKKGAASGSLPGWTSILLCNESIPSSTRPQPILFDTRNTNLEYTDDGVPLIRLRTTNLGSRKSIEDTITIWHKGRSVRSQIDTYKQIVEGRLKFNGSKLTYDKNRRKWFILLSYQRRSEVAPGLDGNKTAYIWPGSQVPFLFREPGQQFRVWLQGRGRHIEMQRQRIFSERRAMSENYRYATNRRGKGYDHANRWRQKYTTTWRQFVKRLNHQMSHDAVQQCIKRGIGNLVYLKPSGSVAENRAVSKLGATGRDQTTWEFFELKTMLSDKCNAAGIHFDTVECDGSRIKAKS